MGVQVFVPPQGPETRPRVSVLRAFTDNQGNGFALNTLLTTKLPLGLVVMELGAQLAHRNVALEAAWTPRTHNAEADALSNGDVRGFDPAKRVDMSHPVWLVLHDLWRLLPGVQQEVTQARQQGQRITGDTGKRKLRESDPW